ncbi:IS66 family insertion sequence element accessory protein TnpB, partial [Palleniella muris]
MLGLSTNLNYYLFNGNVDLRKGIFRLCESIREEMSLDPSDASNTRVRDKKSFKIVPSALIS